MPRKNIDGMWGESEVVTVRFGPKERRALNVLRSAWGGTNSAILRRALHEAARLAESDARLQPMAPECKPRKR